MQQRRVRLGDLLDDYCPRERRITNHAVVAMIEDEVKQTRCATCEAEHVYKGAKVPAPRRKKVGAALSTDVPEGLVRPRPVAAGTSARLDEVESDANARVDESDAIAPADESNADESNTASPEVVDSPEIPVAATSGEPLPAVKDEPPLADAEADEPAAQDDWVHRPLIRATLPRQEGQTPERKAPDFTLRQQGGRFDNNRNGQRHHGGPRPGRPGQPSGQAPRFGSGSGQGPRHGAGGQPPRHGSGQGSPQGQRHGNRPGPGGPAGQNRGPRQGSGPGRKRGR